jgi:hypothetical protein
MGKDLSEYLGDWAVGLSTGLTTLGVLVIPSVQAMRWLVTGKWPALPLSRALEALGVDWVSLAEVDGLVGVSKILFWIFDLPTALCSVVAGVLLFVLLSLLSSVLKS